MRIREKLSVILDLLYLLGHNAHYIYLVQEVPMARRSDDSKVEALRVERSLNPHPEAVRDEAFATSEFLDPRDLVQVKYEMVRRVRIDGKTISSSAATFGFSRPSYYEAAVAIDSGGLAALVPERPGPRRAHKLSEEVVSYMRSVIEADHSLRSLDLVALIEEHFNLHVHQRSIERALTRRPKSQPRQ